MEKKEIILLLIISLFWISIILFYTHGGLLVGGDSAGYYDSSKLFTSLVTPKEVVYDIALFLSGNNIYCGFYLGLFLLTFLTSLSFFYFTKSLLKGFADESYMSVLASLSTFLFLFSLPLVQDTFKSLLNMVSINAAGFFIFLAELSNLIRSTRFNDKFDYKHMLLMGLGLGLSGGVPPNTFRMLILEFIIFVTAMLYMIITLKSIGIVKPILKKSIIPIAISIMVMLYWIIPFFSDFATNMGALFSTYSARSYGQHSRLTPDYAMLTQVLRLLGAWNFPTDYVPYHDLYSNNLLITLASFLWPILALGLPLLLCKKKEKRLLLFLTFSMLIMVFWEKAGNPPLGEIYILLVSNFPQIQAIFPTNFLQLKILATLYPVMTAFSILKLRDLINGKASSLSILKRKIISSLTPACLLGILLISAWPIWSGMAVSQYFDPNIKGIWIPEEYFTIKRSLTDMMRSNETVLLYPAVTTYVQTLWGYQGTNSFYNNFFSPLLIITPDYFGGYSQYDSESWHNYLSLVSPKLLPREKIKLDAINYEKIKVYHTQYQLQNNYTQVYLHDFSYDENSWVDISLPFKESMNFSDYALLTLKVNANSIEYLNQAISNSGLWIGMVSGKYIGWHIIGSSINSNSIIEQNGTIEITLTLGSPDKPWSTSIYYVDNVNGIFIKIKKNSISSNNLTLTFPTLYVSQKVAFNEDYASLIKQYNIVYIIYDASISSGALSAYQSYEIAIDALIKSGFLTIVYNGEFLKLYEIQINK